MQVPLYAANGSRVGRSRPGTPSGIVALIDDSDAELVLAHRWSIGTDGYAIASAYPGKTTLRMHRLIVGLAKGDRRQVDHINGDRLDNRRSNLRIVAAAQNAQNRRSQVGSSSRFRGVAFRTRAQAWEAYVCQGNRKIFLGLFRTETEAAEVAAAKRRDLMPFAVEGR